MELDLKCHQCGNDLSERKGGALTMIPQPNNMGMVRYFLAIGVLVAHFKELAGVDFYFPVSSFSCVGGFFALSGFLIYGSFLKKRSLSTYLISRGRRILPAYWVTVLFFAVVLCCFSTYGPLDYFTSGQFWKYLTSNLLFLNFLEPTLPGVFNGFSVPAVNGSLWTMKVEWALYLSVPVVFWLISRLRLRQTVMFIGIYSLSVAYRFLFLYLYSCSGNEIYRILGRQFFGQLSYFYVGVLLYFYLEQFLRYKWHIFVAVAVLTMSSGYIPYYDIVLHPLQMGVMVVWFSMVGKWGCWEGKRDNVSYNIYLIHFPVIQIFVFIGSLSEMSTFAGLIMTIVMTVLLSFLLNLAERKIRCWMF